MKRRKTAASETVVSILTRSDSALSHKDIQERSDRKLDKVTVYRVLNRLHEDGRVHRVVAADGMQYYALCSDCTHQEHHHDHFHFRCTQCNRLECLESSIRVTLPQGYTLDHYNCVLSGTCAACA